MGKIKKLISLLYVIIRALLPPRKVSAGDKILLIETGHIGDAIVDASAWQAIARDASSRGKEIYLMTPREDWNILKRLLTAGKITFLECDRNLSGIGAINRCLSKLRRLEFDTVIVMSHRNRWVYPLGAAVPAARRCAVIEKELVSSRWSMAVHRLFAGRYADVVIEDEKTFMGKALEKLAAGLGITDYRMALLPMEKSGTEYARPDKYITVAVDSQNSVRRWPADCFIELITELLEMYEDDVVLTGSALGEADTRRYEEAFRGNGRVKNMIGKCSIDEWIELLRGARFHIGVDSGSIHVAASVDTTAFCLTGVWHGHRFFPYDIEDYLPGTTAPICIYRRDVDVENIPCYGCAAKSKYGCGDRECQEKCLSGRPCLCLERITVEDVISAVKKAKQDGKIS